MKLKLVDAEFKSLKQPFEIELESDLTIITGLNGSGKTQLLKGILNGSIQVFEDDNKTQIQPRYIKYIEYTNLTPNQAQIVTSEINNKIIEQIFPLYQNYQAAYAKNPNVLLYSHLQSNTHHESIIRNIAELADKPINNLTRNDFHHFFPIDSDPNRDILYHSFSLIIKRYWDAYLHNQTCQWIASKGQKIAFLTDEQFLKKYKQAPWNLLNNILAKAKLDCRVDAPTYTSINTPYQLQLTDIRTQKKIQFNDLSGGEKVLMSLAIIMYNANLEREFPELVLLDEGDATLNPSMSEHYLNILNDIFVNSKRVKLILSTHSISTVSFAPEKSLYVMHKPPAMPRLVKTSKEEAIKSLSFGVKSFYINYDMRRQVFVESKYDVIFYSKMYELLKIKLDKDVPLHFLSSGVTDKENNKVSNCEEVKRLVKDLHDRGNEKIYGIVDWDMKNVSDERIKVLGQNKRYAIENYIFDPLLIAAFLEREKIITGEDKLEIGFKDTDDYKSIAKMNTIQIQSIVNGMIKKIKTLGNIENTDNNLILVHCINNYYYNVPKWYLYYKGHELEALLKTIYPSLKRKWDPSQQLGDFDLKNAILNRVLADLDLRGFISKDFLDLFKVIQS